MQVVVVRDAETTEHMQGKSKHVAMFEGNGLIDLQVAELAASEPVGGGQLKVRRKENEYERRWARALATGS